jgi:erythromycin esterase-like protein
MARTSSLPPPEHLLERVTALGPDAAFERILALAHRAQWVLIGEASHGTHEFYRVRAELTRRLITEHGFGGVAVEADWPDAYRVNRFVRGESSDRDAVEALSGFERFPQWMWRNRDVVEFVAWLRERNASLTAAAKAGFYGMDLYSLHASIRAVLNYLRETDPAAAERARFRYGCFDQFGEDPQAYGYAASFELSRSCENEAVAQLMEMQRGRAGSGSVNGRASADELFFAEQNARLVANAERYYRSMFERRVSSWNLRDTHMVETLEALAAHHATMQRSPRFVVWAHNSHLGDARATEMGAGGELNVGQLVRERHGTAAINVGFTTYAGSVTAASDWDGPAERKRVRPALPGSYESYFHEMSTELAIDEDARYARNFMLVFAGDEKLSRALRGPLLERAIGVIYRPETERVSHYFQARLPAQFDVVLHYDETRAVEPLEHAAKVAAEEPPETYPTGI